MLPPFGDPFYDVIGIAAVAMIRKRFRSGGSPGASWAPVRSRPGGMPLVDSGILENSVGHLVRPTPAGAAEISVGTADKRAAIHHFGGEIRPRKARALFIPISPLGRRIGPRPKGERAVTSVKTNRRTGAETYRTDTLVRGVDFILVGSVTIPARPYLFLAGEQLDQLRRIAVRELRARGYGGSRHGV